MLLLMLYLLSLVINLKNVFVVFITSVCRIFKLQDYSIAPFYVSLYTNLLRKTFLVSRMGSSRTPLRTPLPPLPAP
jgi:hypothetical protein